MRISPNGRSRSLALLLASLLACLVLAGCADRIDYDVEEVATEEYLRGTDDEYAVPENMFSDPTVYRRYDETYLCVSGEPVEEEVSNDGGHLHEHGTGQRNHGTEWFFNQPWAASFIWPKMIRDTVILVVLAGAVLTVSSLTRRRRG